MQMLLEVRNLSKQFDVHHLNRNVAAFHDLSFTLSSSEFVLVAGPNGVGKSTLLRCLYRTYLPSAGAALYHSLHGVIDLARAADVDIVKLRNDEIGHVTQFLRARPRISAIEWVAEPLMIAGTPRDSARDAAADWLQDFGLKRELWEAYPTTFSGGEQQKVNLARALIAPRRLILLDEPTASLDVQARAALVSRLAQLKNAGVAMIGVFHHAEDVADLVNREVRLSSNVEQLALNGTGRANGYVAE